MHPRILTYAVGNRPSRCLRKTGHVPTLMWPIRYDMRCWYQDLHTIIADA